MNRFVVQEHHASHLHWDFRLEKEGVLKSWAVPKGVPEERAVKRLAVQVEDHDISYIDFEGIISEGQYGAGTVTICDHGTYMLEDESSKRILFEVYGKRLQGKYTLVHLKENQWLLIKL